MIFYKELLIQYILFCFILIEITQEEVYNETCDCSVVDMGQQRSFTTRTKSSNQHTITSL